MDRQLYFDRINSNVPWSLDRRFRLFMSFDKASVRDPFTPVSIYLDFTDILRTARPTAGPMVDPTSRVCRESITLVNFGAGSDPAHQNAEAIPINLSERFGEGESGDLSFVIRRPDELEYVLYFDVEEKQSGKAHGNASSPERPRSNFQSETIALVGNGDVIRYGSGTPEPFDVAMPIQLPVFVDWTGDGRLDALCGSIYANTIGFPYHSSWFFRNVGSNDAPVYDDFVRLKADGEYITDCAFDVFDWNGNGLQDLICKPYGKNEIQVYENTGERDACGLPILLRGERVELSDAIGRGGQTGIGSLQLFDFRGDGRVSLIGVIRELNDTSQFGHIFGPYYDNAVVVFESASSPGENARPPRFKPPYRLTLADGSPLSLKGSSGGSVCDWNSDGVWDVVLVEVEGSKRYLRLIENTGTNDNPSLVDAGRFLDGRNNPTTGKYYNNASYHGMITVDSDCMFRYFEDLSADSPESAAPDFRDRGNFRQLHGRVSIGVYSWPWVCDWDGDGGRDIVTGSASGMAWVTEEAGRHDPPVYRPRRLIEAAGEPIWHTWGTTLTQTGGERTEGYWQPAMYDWDNDGLDDLIVPVGISHGKMVDGSVLPDGRLFFYRNIGNRDQPRFAASEEMLLENGEPPMASHTAYVLDWDGDGRGEIVAMDFEQRLCVYRLKSDPKVDPLTLLPGVPLLMTDGSVFSAETVYEIIGRRWGMQHAVCDWRGAGVWDIIIGTKEMLLLFKNAGSNEEPRYAPGERMCLWGEPLSHSTHSLRPFPVDWDGTGRMDLIAGSESGWFHLFRRPVFERTRPTARISVVYENRGDGT